MLPYLEDTTILSRQRVIGDDANMYATLNISPNIDTILNILFIIDITLNTSFAIGTILDIATLYIYLNIEYWQMMQLPLFSVFAVLKDTD